jgi:hypothetical protein
MTQEDVRAIQPISVAWWTSVRGHLNRQCYSQRLPCSIEKVQPDALERRSESTQWLERQVGLSRRQPLLQVSKRGFELTLLGSCRRTQQTDFISRYVLTSWAMDFECARSRSRRRAHQRVERGSRIGNSEGAEFMLDRAQGTVSGTDPRGPGATGPEQQPFAVCECRVRFMTSVVYDRCGLHWSSLHLPVQNRRTRRESIAAGKSYMNSRC